MFKLLKFVKGLSRKQKFILLLVLVLSSLSVEFNLNIKSSTEIDNLDFIEQIKKDWSIESSIKINGAS